MKICQAIKELSQRVATPQTAFVSHLTPTQHAKLVNLVGRKCTVKCLLNDSEVTALSLGHWCPSVNNDKRHVGGLDFNVGLDLMAANGTKIPFIGWADVRVQLPSSTEEKLEVHVPFLITLGRLEMPILGYNVIEELVRMDRWEGEFSLGSSVLKSLKAGFVNSDESQLEALINLIKASGKDYLCALRTSKKATIIPRGQTTKVPCRANTGPVTSNTPVLFEPDELSPWPAGLEIYETLMTVRKGSVSRIEIDVHNTSQHDIIIPGRTQLGRFQLVKSVTLMEVKLAEPDSDRVANPECTDNLHTVAGVEKEESPQESNDVIPEVDMSGLTSEQQEVFRKMLKEEAASFAKNEDDIGCIEGLHMDIDLSDSTPVQ